MIGKLFVISLVAAGVTLIAYAAFQSPEFKAAFAFGFIGSAGALVIARILRQSGRLLK